MDSESLKSITELSAKAMSAAGGFLGGISLMVYIKPKDLKEATIRAAVSTVAALLVAPAITYKIFEPDPISPETIGGIAFGVGFIAWNILGAIAIYFQSRQGQDVVQLYKGAKDGDDSTNNH